jgi:hypothetical protein
MLMAGMARACPVPVFRYALERWEADTYQVVVFHRGEMAADGRGAVEGLKRLTASGGGKANMEVIVVDATRTEDAQWKALAEKHKERAVPWAAIVLPAPVDADDDKAKVVWTGALGELSAEGLADSPKRREIAKKILEGDSAVWVVLESGDKARDAAAVATLRAETSRFAKNAPAPLEGVDETELAGFGFSESVPLRVSFAVVTIAADDAAEKWFVRLLRGLYPELPTGKPAAIPVFGRGRALGAATGDEIQSAVIRKGCEFLTGACTCEVKGQNPGHDLLMTVDWARSLHGGIKDGAPLPPLVGAVDVAQVVGTMPAAPLPIDVHVAPPTHLSRNLWVTLGAGLAAVAVATVVILLRSANGKASR